MVDKKNAFDVLRLLLAACVVITHGCLVGGYPLQDPLAILSKGQTNLGEFGVMGFFALSGYLITASFKRTNLIFQFAVHRALRLLPGFWVCLLMTGFVFAPLLFCLQGHTLHSFNFTGDNSSVSYIYQNCLLSIKQWTIKDTLSSAAYQGSLNGSLWSLAPEAACYLFTVAAGLFGLFDHNRFLYLLLFGAVSAYFAIHFNFSKSYGPSLLILSPAFKLYASYLAGTLLYVFGDKLRPDVRGTAFSALFALMLIKFGGFHLLSPLLIAVVLINAFRLFEFRLKYDISYGIYIYSFPIQQVLFQLFGNRLNPVIYIGLSLLLSAGMGLLSCLWIEQPAIHLRKKLDRYFRSDYKLTLVKAEAI